MFSVKLQTCVDIVHESMTLWIKVMHAQGGSIFFFLLLNLVIETNEEYNLLLKAAVLLLCSKHNHKFKTEQ